jgi:ABC-type lipoprotein export system ATPase subunit
MVNTILENMKLSKYSERQRAQLRKGSIGFVFQSFNLIDELTVFENVELPLLYMKVPAAERKQRVEEVLERMNIMHRRNHFPQQLIRWSAATRSYLTRYCCQAKSNFGR